MEIRSLRYAVTLADELHFGRAAWRHFISAQPFGRHIQQLEREVGCQLFEQTSRRVRVTPAGERFLADARKVDPLVCEYCDFDTAPRFVEASTRTVRIVESRLPGLNGARMRADGIVNLYRTLVSGVLRLDRASVTGELFLREAAIGEDDAGKVVADEGLVIDGALGYAVEVGLLGANPVDGIQWKAPEVAETVDRRVVVSPAQARALLAGVRA